MLVEGSRFAPGSAINGHPGRLFILSQLRQCGDVSDHFYETDTKSPLRALRAEGNELLLWREDLNHRLTAVSGMLAFVQSPVPQPESGCVSEPNVAPVATPLENVANEFQPQRG